MEDCGEYISQKGTVFVRQIKLQIAATNFVQSLQNILGSYVHTTRTKNRVNIVCSRAPSARASNQFISPPRGPLVAANEPQQTLCAQFSASSRRDGKADRAFYLQALHKAPNYLLKQQYLIVVLFTLVVPADDVENCSPIKLMIAGSSMPWKLN